MVDEPLVDRTAIVLERLKEQGCVPPEIRLVRRLPQGDFSNFRAGGYNRDKITKLGKDDKLSEEAIAFALLHETSHLRRRQNSRAFRWLMTIALAFPFAYTVYYTLIGLEIPAEGFLAIALYFFFLLAGPRVYREPLMRDEIEADIYAGLMTSKYAGVGKPSELARKALGEIMGPKPPKDTRGRRIMIFLGYDVHPPLEERVRLVAERADPMWERLKAEGRTSC
jgi:Zn-dependent protease with chaperone function